MSEPFKMRILGGAALVLGALFMHEIVPALRRPRARQAGELGKAT